MGHLADNPVGAERNDGDQSNLACRLCGGQESCHLFSKTILGLYEVGYFECKSCGSLQTQFPYWLDEAYSIPGVHLDVGIASRSVKNWFGLSALLNEIDFPKDSLAIDFGTSRGLFARLMRDAGYSFFGYDKFSIPEFVNYFCLDSLEGSRPALITAFEVFEHFAEPAKSLKQLFETGASMIVFSTWFYKGHDKDWIYIAAECGQHVFFYTESALRNFAAEHGYELKLTAFFFLLLRPGSLEAHQLAGIDRFAANSEEMVRGTLVSQFENVKFGNDFMNRDLETARAHFDKALEDLARNRR